MHTLLVVILVLAIVCLALGWRVTNLERFQRKLRRAFHDHPLAVRNYLLGRTDALPESPEED